MTPLRRLFCLALAGGILLPALARAQLTIEISGTGSNQVPVAIANFEGEHQVPRKITEVVRSDLERSGLFRLIETGTQQIGANASPDLPYWKSRGADALLVGSIAPLSGGRYEVRFRLLDAARQTDLASLSYSYREEDHRKTAHRIADTVYEKLLGEPGAFSTHIAYVIKQGRKYQLLVAEYDGLNPQAALISDEPIISPVWSPDGSRLAYVSFEKKKPIIYIHNLAAGQRTVLANFKGSNSAPAWAPDGRRLAVVLTKDGRSQLYSIGADGGTLVRLTNSGGIDTEPSFSPDGQWIYFTSDRGGSPQIYRVPATGGSAERVSFEGSYNVTPRVSPDGKSLAYISRNGGRFQLTVLDLATRQTQVLTDSAKDETPSFAPNGRMILYATELGGRGVLAAVSSDGGVRQRLSQTAADVREPAWGPFAR